MAYEATLADERRQEAALESPRGDIPEMALDELDAQDALDAADQAGTREHVVELGRRGSTDSPSEAVKAYELYLKGRYLWNQRSEESVNVAIELFRRALGHDAGHAPTLAALADCYTLLGTAGARAPQEVMPLAKAAAAKALARDPSLGEAYASLGCVRAMFDFDWSGAERDFLRAIEIQPSNPAAHQWYALDCLAPLGRFPEALVQLEAGRLLDPLSPVIPMGAGLVHFFVRRYDWAIREYRHSLELAEHFPRAHSLLGLVLTEAGRHEEAIAALERAIALCGREVHLRSALGYAYARAGMPREAERELADMVELSEQSYVSPTLIAQVHAGLRDREKALAALEAAYAVRASDLVWLKVHPAFDGLWEDARYTALLRQVGLEGRARV